MELQLIRNATMRIRYGSVCFVTDPLLAPKLTMKSYAGKSPDPLVDLPVSIEKVLLGMEFVLLSHIHSDHFDKTAQQTLPKDALLYCQQCDLERLNGMGFTNVKPVDPVISYKGIRITRTKGSHGQGAVLEEMGIVSGFIFSSPEEPTIYWVGDSILNEGTLNTIDQYRPDVIITHSSGAVWGSKRELIVMDADQTLEVCKHSPNSVVVAIHLDALDHGTVTKEDLVNARNKAQISEEKLIIPEDGKTLVFQRGKHKKQ